MKAYKTKFCIIFYMGVKLLSQIKGRKCYWAFSNGVLEGKREGKRKLWRPRHRGDDNIKIHLKK